MNAVYDRTKPRLTAESPTDANGRTREFELGQVAQGEAEFFRSVCGYAYHIHIWCEVRQCFLPSGSFYPN